MRIAFDLDDTLIPCGHRFPLEPPTWPARLLAREPLRRGTVDLFRRLRSLGCRVWVYTTSHRPPFEIRTLFLCYGLWLNGVVNQDRHRARMIRRHAALKHLAKYPPAFGLDLLVDECEGVRLEAARHGFPVVQVRPDDEDWADAVLDAVKRLRAA